jgi:hypothetical protein
MYTKPKISTTLPPKEIKPVGGVVKLNIGGVKFQTTQSTLIACEFFVDMFSTEFAIITDDEDCIFVDRDGSLFEIILRYLRTGTIKCDSDLIPDLLIEEKFYRIPSLQGVLKKEMNPPTEQIAGCRGLVVVSLNVGGKIFYMSERWLEGKFNAAVSSGNWSGWAYFLDFLAPYRKGIDPKKYYEDHGVVMDNEGNPFVDRDPEIFAQMLQILRIGTYIKYHFSVTSDCEYYFGCHLIDRICTKINSTGKNHKYNF